MGPSDKVTVDALRNSLPELRDYGTRNAQSTDLGPVPDLRNTLVLVTFWDFCGVTAVSVARYRCAVEPYASKKCLAGLRGRF